MSDLDWSGCQVFCPWCAKPIRDLWDYGWDGSEDEQVETECGQCDGAVVIHRRVEVDYAVSKPETTP